MVVYKGHLYIGGYNDPMNALEKAMQMDFSDLYKDLESPVNLWRMDVDEDGNENFEMLAGEANNKYFAIPKAPSMAIPCCPAWATATSRAVT